MTDKKKSSGPTSSPGLDDKNDPRRRESRSGKTNERKNFAHDDRKHSPEKNGRRENRDAPDRPRGPGGAAGALIELDRDLMKLLVRRATLVSRIREGKDHAASPAAIQAEKAVRIAWETGALAFSKDPRFSRQLFSLLQDIKVLGKDEAELSGSFTLNPHREIVSGSITGPTSTRTAQMRLALAAFLGKSLRLEPIMLSSALMDSVKACEQAGASLSWTSESPARSRLILKESPAISLSGKSVFLGEDPFTAYLLLFFALGTTGVCRLNGGSALKSLDLSPLRQVLPLFGARLAHVVPHSNGLPANLECSGEIPPHILIPAELPEEALSALLLAPLVWNVPVVLDLSALPAATATAALAEVRPLHRDSGAEVDGYGPRLTYTPSPLTPPEAPALPLDPALSAYLLAIIAFTGGSLEMKGIWPSDMPEAAEAAQLFAWSGIDFIVSENSVTARKNCSDTEAKGLSQPDFSLPMQCDAVSPSLGPLFLALSALCLKTNGESPPLNSLLGYPESESEIALAAEFFDRLGLCYEDGRLSVAASDGPAGAKVPSWTSPGTHWSLAYALGALLGRRLELANPATVSAHMPLFWAVYNSLPKATDVAGTAKKKEESGSGKATRRRIITG